MSRFRTAAGLAALAVVAALAGPSAPAVAVTATVSNVSVTPSSVSVDGLGDAVVTVQADIDEPRGAPTDVRASLQAVSGAPGGERLVIVGLSEVAGTRSATTATYRGTWLVAATRSGSWHLMTISWNYAPDWGDSVDPGSGLPGELTVTVTGTHAPTFSIVKIPAVVPYGARQWARYTIRHSDGTPLVSAAVLVHYCFGDICWAPRTVRTDARGQATVRLLASARTWCSLTLPSTTSPGQSVEAAFLSGDRSQTYTTVSAAAPAAVRKGRAFTVRATVQPWVNSVVDLQRLVGRTWKTVARGWVGPTGHASIPAVSTVLGRQFFRLRASGGPEMVPTTSRPFVVVGSRR